MPGRGTWPGHSRTDRNTICFKHCARWAGWSWDDRKNSSLSTDHRSPMERMEDWDSPTVIAETHWGFLHAFVFYVSAGDLSCMGSGAHL